MGFDAKLKRYLPLIVCAAIALAAYLQASGIGQLIAATVGEGTADGAAGPGPVRVPAPTKRPSGRSILARNPFDSITGPLDGRPSMAPGALADGADEMPLDGGLPSGEDPSCDFGRVLLISASNDPDWSFAAIETDGKSMLRRQGDDVKGHTMHAMGWDRVWFDDGGKRCQMKLGDKSKVRSRAAGKPAKPARRSRRHRGRRLPPDLAAKIHKVSDTEYNIERSLVDEVLENQAQLMRSARIVPEKRGDEVVGIRMFGIRSGSLLGSLGMKNGDRLESINGFPMNDPQKALEAYGRVRTADKLRVQVNRKGSPVTLEFNIQ